MPCSLATVPQNSAMAQSLNSLAKDIEHTKVQLDLQCLVNYYGIRSSITLYTVNKLVIFQLWALHLPLTLGGRISF